MIYALVGPDGVGKTTLFENLRGKLNGFVFVPCVPFDDRLIPAISVIEQRAIALWEALYDPAKQYLCDRTPFIDNRVYARVYGRFYNGPPWTDKVFALYLRPVVSMDPAVDAYDAIVPEYKHAVINASQEPFEVLYDALKVLTRC